jgi:hypothetical protein
LNNIHLSSLYPLWSFFSEASNKYHSSLRHVLSIATSLRTCLLSFIFCASL